jgi:hypothetical protein
MSADDRVDPSQAARRALWLALTRRAEAAPPAVRQHLLSRAAALEAAGRASAPEGEASVGADAGVGTGADAGADANASANADAGTDGDLGLSATPASPLARTGPDEPAMPSETLKALVARLNAPDAPGDGSPEPTDGAAASVPTELRTVRRHRATWTRLRLQRQMRLSRAKVPEHAGPLNAQRVVQRMLGSLDHMAPRYLQQVLVQIEALMWLEDAGRPPTPAPGASGAKGRNGPGGAGSSTRQKGSKDLKKQ